MSHSIHMLSIQIDTKSLKFDIYHQFNNVKLSFFASHIKSVLKWVKIFEVNLARFARIEIF